MVKIGDVVFLAQPQEAQYVANPNDQENGVKMIAIDTDNGKRWMPLNDEGPVHGDMSNMMSKSTANLGYCSVRGMW